MIRIQSTICRAVNLLRGEVFATAKVRLLHSEAVMAVRRKGYIAIIPEVVGKEGFSLVIESKRHAAPSG